MAEQPVIDTEELIIRMRNGDRIAAAMFIEANRDLIRRRIRSGLGDSTRRLYDSQDVLSTLVRRLDKYVLEGRLRAQSPGEFWSLVQTIVSSAIVDRQRVIGRLRTVESEDSEFARHLQHAMHDAEARGGHAAADVRMADVFEALKDSEDRQLLAHWLSGWTFVQIASELGISHDAARQRWRTIREHLRTHFEEGTLAPSVCPEKPV